MNLESLLRLSITQAQVKKVWPITHKEEILLMPQDIEIAARFQAVKAL